MSFEAASAIATGHTFWLFGLSGAGKSTLATALIAGLRTRNIAVLALDGDALRAGLCRGLGFSDADRTENLRRAAEAAQLGAASGLCVVASFITPLETQRHLVTQILGADHVSFVYVDAPFEVCRARDTKGLYARAEVGQVAQMTGVSSAFEAPRFAALSLPTAQSDIGNCSAQLLAFALARLVQSHR